MKKMRTARSDSRDLPHMGLFLLFIHRVLPAHRIWPVSPGLLLSIRLMVLLCIESNYSVIISDTSRCYWSPAWFFTGCVFHGPGWKKEHQAMEASRFADTVSPVPVQWALHGAMQTNMKAKNQQQLCVLVRICSCTSWTGVRQDWKGFPPEKTTAVQQQGLHTPIPTQSGVNARNTLATPKN